jgi:hypothetical protein
MSIQVDTNERGDGREFFEMLGLSKIIHEMYLADEIDPDSVIQWNFDYVSRKVRDGNTVLFQEPNSLDRT